ncbi:hypothetical protein HHK36_013806 [Tetracentron sinense]|uniref:Uncharacterized protein n=1 Tax=Tetracentron sinense TaxID=13715 RepID=A0A834Z8U2_TETSI|nr:hypothetical protein HHK36_013806 [Tetracentron sinense]
MLKKMKKEAKDSSRSYVVDEEARTRFKHQSLFQDFVDLQKETVAMKKKLTRAKQKKLTLLAEVRFLRRRYKYLLKTQSPKPQPEQALAQPQRPEIRNENLAKGRSFTVKETALQKPSPLFDLNQISVFREPMKVDKKPKKKCLISGGSDEQPADMKLYVCRDIGNESNRIKKRKISWQDQENKIFCF